MLKTNASILKALYWINPEIYSFIGFETALYLPSLIQITLSGYPAILTD